ncbi:hypothetical protein FPOAC2_12033 [Fusarium poae]|uniref:Protein kinase domain-containing protein n=1 Tax=Fusarium poae TaxID=36050 RepID=A0A1B8AFB2_FUSPO|nr:hypothetical protein FPOAC1_011717 [Fusarium poae]KAG8666895.1 hypothetical protein FPOAC1_011717 [Fusarium poae]OBS19140.1 hypothetical protein FPOA_10863 [Fusarium poae]
MEKITQDLSAILETNWQGENFISFKRLEDALSSSSIKKVLAEADLQPYHQNDAFQAVQQGGRRVFATLCTIHKPHLILDFIAQDGFLKGSLDSKMPLEEEVLRIIIPKDYRVFFDAQWPFCSPLFQHNLSHRRLHARTILPFLEMTSKGQGGFGNVYHVSLPHFHQDLAPLATSRVNVAIKEFRSSPSQNDDAFHEQHMLSLLRHLQHPNIIKFYAAFSLKSVPQLILEVADCDLTHLLSHPRPNSFEESIIFTELYGLSSAIHELHNYFSDELELKLTGCHYDLKPGNILVKGTRLLLSDFGLSRMKPEIQGSASSFKGGLGDYLAPECQDLSSSLEKTAIRRSSDIWSFGCILAETLTWLEGGPVNVAEFRQKRKVTFMGFLSVNTFHADLEPSKVVLDWLGSIESSTSFLHRRQLIGLIREMLEFEADKRPTSSVVVIRSFKFALRAAYVQIYEGLENLITSPDFHLLVERERFRAWASVSGLTDVNQEQLVTETTSRLRHQTICESLRCLKNTISARLCQISDPDPTMISFTHVHAIRNHIDSLWAAESQAAVARMVEITEQYALAHSPLSLETIVKNSDIPTSPLYKRIHLMIAMRQVSVALESPVAVGNSMRIHRSMVAVTGTFSDKRLGFLRRSGHDQCPIIIEFLNYSSSWIDRPDELLERVSSLAGTLSKLKDLGSLPILKCEGFYHHPEEQAIGLIFKVPNHKIPTDADPQQITLTEMIKLANTKETRPSLDKIFWAASTLANAVLSFHQAGWYHKNISSSNILFPLDTLENPAQSLHSPFITGFNHSREDQEGAFTVGPSNGLESEDYKHPSYGSNTRFQRCFDYYSLGLVLLEMGRWRNLKRMIRGHETLSPMQVRDMLLEKEVPQLRYQTGQLYHNAVRSCLDGSLDECARDVKILDDFKAKVAMPLKEHEAICVSR